MIFDEDIKDFLIECHENLSHLDRDLLLLEDDPSNASLVASSFRAIHNIKGTSGFFGFSLLGALTHAMEDVLSLVREGRSTLTNDLIALIFEAVDATRSIIQSIEAAGIEGEDITAGLRLRLQGALLTRVVSTDIAAPHSVNVTSLPSLHLVSSFIMEDGGLSLDQTEPRDASPAAGYPQENVSQLVDSTVRVDVGVLDRLMDLVGELVLARNQLLQDAPEQSSLQQQAAQRLKLITSELQEGVLKTRMQPINIVWAKLPRVVHDIAAQCGKKIRIVMEGGETELDRTIIEAIKDPLTHLVRNCCDHGIEIPEQRLAAGKKPEGSIHLRAYHAAGLVHVEISDDGVGIDSELVRAKAVERGLLLADQAARLSNREAKRLIFKPGFSTAPRVTGISGRGVGMDVVNNNIVAVGGAVEILDSVCGATVRISIPLTLAIIPGLVVTLWSPDPPNEDRSRPQSLSSVEASWSIAERRAAAAAYAAANPKQPKKLRPEDRFVIPQRNLAELVRITADHAAHRIKSVHNATVLDHRGKLIPLVHLCTLLGREEARRRPDDDINVVILQWEHNQFGLIVDRIFDTQEIVIKPLGRQLKNLTSYLGATIMGDGCPALILDIPGLACLAGIRGHAPQVPAEETSVIDTKANLETLLLFKVAPYPRVAVSLCVVDRLEDLDAAAIEHAAARMATPYCGEILPIVTMHELSTGQLPDLPPGRISMVIFKDGERRAGLIVDQILDIVEAEITGRRLTYSPGLLGSGLVNGLVTDLLDVQAVFAVAEEHWRHPASSAEVMSEQLPSAHSEASQVLAGAAA